MLNFLKKYAEENGPNSFTNEKQKKKPKIDKPKGNIFSMPRKRIKYSEDIENLVPASEMDNDVDKQKKILLKKMLGSLTSHTPRLYAEVSICIWS